ncbi:ATP-binding protein [Reyranella sp.]|uniref:ATP-binding protein n=1 Tax=Reyranella sp. TaxID=1929291 RepID=UPI003BAB4426
MKLIEAGVGTRIRTQITVLVFLTGMISSGLVALLLIVLQSATGDDRQSQGAIDQVAPLLRTLDALAPDARPVVMENLRNRTLQIDLGGLAGDSQAPDGRPLPKVSEALAAVLGGRITVPLAVEDPSGRLSFEARLMDGQGVVVRLTPPAPLPPMFPLLPPLLLFVALSTALSLWAGLRIVAPLTRFAAAVERFGLDGRDAPLPEEGPAEIRKATGAFNRMRERILRLIADRTQMMMAISHDLRTPLTRLRLRTEDIRDEELRGRMRKDMDAMESSISDAVASLRHASVAEGFERTDLTSVVGTICDEFTDAGFNVEFETAERVAGWVRPQAVARAVSNLVQNATKYGARVAVRIDRPRPDIARIEVEDDGPGIPAHEREAVLKPFYRMDPARMDGGGFGLGLAIADDVARSHKGALTLLDGRPHGLRARLELKIAPCRPPSTGLL